MSKKNQITIGIDARFFGPRQKGLGRYVQKLVEELEENFQFSIFNFQFIIFLRKENWDEYRPQNHNFKKVLADYRWYGLKEQALMPFKIWREKIDLMHFPHFNLPIFCPAPFLVTIHDLVLKRFPTRRASKLGPILYRLKNLAYQFVIWRAIKKSEKIITVSNYTKNDILKYFKVRPEKIEVIYEGSPEIKLKTTTKNLKLLEKHNISKPYLLYVGNAYPHKNLERLILAFKKLIEDYETNLQLVLVGELDYFYQQLKDYTRYKIQDTRYKQIVFTDFVPDKDLEVLYKNASLYIFPSLCEGFGLPSLEAMSYGLPIISSKATCLPEILEEAAFYFDPENIEEITEAIKRVLEDSDLQKKLIVNGFEQIKKYSWSKMAEQTLGVYQKIILSRG
ncbi:MAG: hypothetical protein A3A94_02000 [Candidatus Portnoybacteria bacterium RIFCSPLOWO2_01_FULL_43_11]|uniref:Glycosyl transferase family 1 n=4 Tax=Candidatus Portnoyibacteriota TaxID=1817913 RepID=A0A1G2FDA2_9BACT|nr:MAG: hypothetical protein A2815_01815 [Candidatus Portnoybacteria bacterium RIFCSPHIGHO2_01_FULL_40_12b]OGZ37146.1 MAG: hypothetical protein A3D38_01230 [Candidatus Portnoybacteria bacterium RIFCSPHIGHO2_02_FULL_40_23]OGZ38790.1 MAG: hypothetical protein A3A94_02000 [Candidatus Portnoybacteria bacterium RIFCSPLOWO2_01_FULL_43_11]OGZ41132.1 MAG: hypothetical protein A3I20_02005 [Candidatus Portnoybacteria bacterium RIFCSPLOWO2_02_FULL_40_15]